MAVFTNFAASLARQPSAALLAPRLNKSVLSYYFFGFETANFQISKIHTPKTFDSKVAVSRKLKQLAGSAASGGVVDIVN